MFENERMTRAAICGTGLLLAAVFLFAGLPIVLLVIPVAVIFLGLVADPEETHAVWYGMLFVLCVFEVPALTEAEKENYAVKRHYFWFGEVGMATILAGLFAVPSGYWLAGQDRSGACRDRCRRCLPPALCLPAKSAPVGDAGRRGCRHRRVREKRACPEGLLGGVRGGGGARARPDRRSGNGTGDRTGDSRLNPFFYLRTGNVKVLVVGPGGKTSGPEPR